ncbi:MAG TPA: aminotransferase class V-fold PLP-dependent enzyme [Micromonosporaceae bacterium]|nr:aminotransferase class V-fold PLP-dependent enzyme [Micromonosporaceae bacterium]
MGTETRTETTTDHRAAARAADRDDPLAAYRQRFVIDDPDLVYLDGNSLGRLPLAARDRLRAAIDEEWGRELIRGWDHWMDLCREGGDVIAGLVGAAPGQVVLSDSTSVNLYKLASAALDARPGRGVIVTDDDNFPTDRYVLAGLAAERGAEVRVIATDMDRGITLEQVREATGADTALVSLSHVAYRSGAVADLAGITAAVHEAGALMLWDLCHSAGAVPVGLDAARADLAVGCTYKHLNGGPGAPAFLYVRADLQSSLRQPIWGWFSQRDQFAMGAVYDPVDSIERFLVGTTPVLGAYAALEGARVSAEAGIDAIVAKGRALTSFALEIFDSWPEPYGCAVASPREAARRGAQVTLHHPAAWQVCQALKAAGVIPDFRTPDRLRLGFAPLYTRFEDVHEGMLRLRRVLETCAHLEFPAERGRVT